MSKMRLAHFRHNTLHQASAAGTRLMEFSVCNLRIAQVAHTKLHHLRGLAAQVPGEGERRRRASDRFSNSCPYPLDKGIYNYHNLF